MLVRKQLAVTCCLAATCILCIALQVCWSQEERKLKISIVGSIFNQDPQYNPFTICRPDEVKRLLLEMAESPMDKDSIVAGLGDCSTKIEDLLRVEIIRQEGDLYYINFPLFTESDEAKIMAAAEKYGKVLAEQVLEQACKINALLDQLSPPAVGRGKYAFIIVGYMALDSGALRLLAKHDYIVHKPKKPGGNRYVFSGEEVTEFSLKGLYWGGHTTRDAGIVYLTFGDHNTETTRYGFPDLAYKIRREFSLLDVPDIYKKEFLAVNNDYFRKLLGDIKIILFHLKSGPAGFDGLKNVLAAGNLETRRLLELLEKIDYIKKEDEEYHLRIPVLSASDKDVLTQINQIVSQEVLKWTESHYSHIKTELSDINAVKSGVDYKEVFNMLWHYFFGYANRHLVRSGLFYDPYADSEVHKGYLPAVAEMITMM